MHHPARDYPSVFKSNVNQFELELPRTLAYTAAPKNYTYLYGAAGVLGRNASKEETGVNEAGVAVSVALRGGAWEARIGEREGIFINGTEQHGGQ